MALILTRLRWALTLNGWRKSVLTLVLSILGALYLLSMAATLVTLLVTALPGQAVETRGAVTVLAASALVLAWLVIPPLVTGIDATLDPRSFLLFPVPARTLMAGLLVSAFTTPVGALTLLTLLGAAASWWDTPLALASALPGAALSAVTAIALGYGVTGLMAAYTGRRRVRETISLVLLVPIMLGGVVLMQVVESLDSLFAVGPRIAAAAAWTPFGAGLGAGWAAAEGNGGVAAARLAVAVVWCAAALAVWHLAIRRTVEPASTGGTASADVRGASALSWMGRPATGPRTAIAARAQLYWFKDPRYMASLVALPVMAVLFWFLGSTAPEGAEAMYLMLGPITAWMLAFSISADIAYDHTAFHLHVVSGVRGIDDRLGRLMGLAGWAVPVVLLVTVASVALAGDWTALPALLGVDLGVFGANAGLSCLVSARWVYPVPKPGESPLKSPQGAAMRIMIVQGTSMLVSLALAIPVIVPVIVFMVTGAAVWSWATLAVGLVWGAAGLWLGVRVGAAWYDRAQAETLQAVKAW